MKKSEYINPRHAERAAKRLSHTKDHCRETIALDPIRLREARERHKRTQGEQAQIADIGRVEYSRIESGARPDPRMSTAVKIARSLGTRVEDLLVWPKE